MAITTLLLDADGVVQRSGPLRGRIEHVLGHRADFADIFPVEQRAIDGRVDVREAIGEFLLERRIPASADEVLSVWNYTEPDADVLALVDRVRAAGTPVHLATNQQPVRGQWMLETLDYDDHFDRLFMSYQMGAAKPSAEYFEHIINALGIDPAQTLFIDDVAANVEGARACGLHAETIVHDAGAEVIASILDAYGVRH